MVMASILFWLNGFLAVVAVLTILFRYRRSIQSIQKQDEVTSSPGKLSQCEEKSMATVGLPNKSTARAGLPSAFGAQGHSVQVGEPACKLSKSQRRKKNKKLQKDPASHEGHSGLTENESSKEHAGNKFIKVVAAEFVAEHITNDDTEAWEGKTDDAEGRCHSGHVIQGHDNPSKSESANPADLGVLHGVQDVCEISPSSASTTAADLGVLHDLEEDVVESLEHDITQSLESDVMQTVQDTLDSIGVSKEQDVLHVYELDEAGKPVLRCACSSPTDIGSATQDAELLPVSEQASGLPEMIYFYHEDMPFLQAQDVDDTVPAAQKTTQYGDPEVPASQVAESTEPMEVVPDPPGLTCQSALVDPGPPPGLDFTSRLDLVPAAPTDLTLGPPPGLDVSLPARKSAPEVVDDAQLDLDVLLQSISLELDRVASSFADDFSSSNLTSVWASSTAMWESLSTPSRGAEQFANHPVMFGDASMYEATTYEMTYASSASTDELSRQLYSKQVMDSSVTLDHFPWM
jgi:hypothetical protein